MPQNARAGKRLLARPRSAALQPSKLRFRLTCLAHKPNCEVAEEMFVDCLTDMEPPKPLPFHREMNFEYGKLQPVTPGVRRLVCNNPSSFTFHGTNTYVAGEGSVAVIDPGPDAPDQVESLLAALGRNGERVSHILITHTHSDHTGNAALLKERTGAPVYGMPRGASSNIAAAQSPSGKNFLTPVDYDQPLAHGDLIDGEGWALKALHTPGHAPDHLCYAFPSADVLFSGDHVMGWNTTVIAPPEGHMGSYIRSLEILLDGEESTYLPGHGGSIGSPQRLVKALIMHRRWREAEIVECVRSGLNTTGLIVPKIYAQLESALAGAAALSVFAQLEFLLEKGIVETRGQPSLHSEFALTS